MKSLVATVMSLFLLASPSAASSEDSQTIKITRSGAQPSSKGPAEYFTGSVRIDPLFTANDPSRTSGARVTFEPGARTAWHTHPVGQILIAPVLRQNRAGQGGKGCLHPLGVGLAR